jgi:hypothetical protein
MQIEIQKTPWIGGLRPTSLRLHVFLLQGRAFATWHEDRSTRSPHLRIPVSDELASQLLGATRVPCPYVGDLPEYGSRISVMYSCRSGVSGEDATTIDSCRRCGHIAIRSGSPRFRAAMGDTLAEQAGVHPPTTILASDLAYAPVLDADWNALTSQLVPPSVQGTVKIRLGRFGWLLDVKASASQSQRTVLLPHP